MSLSIFDYLLQAPLPCQPINDLEQWWRLHVNVVKLWSTPFEQCVAAGFAADRIGYSFASGYQIAMSVLTKNDKEERMCLCATENTPGAPPGSILTTIKRDSSGGWLLNGEKGFVTLGTYAEQLVIVARDADANQDSKHVKLVLVRVSPRAEGVTIVKRPPLPFIPEVPHARVHLVNVRVKKSDFLGDTALDGFTHFVKPFRTIEDCYVNGALLGYLARNLRAFCFASNELSTRTLLQKILVVTAALQEASRLSPSASSTHALLAGTLDQLKGVIAEARNLFELSTHPDAAEFRLHFARDAKLLNVAAHARNARTKMAWNKLRAHL